MKESTKLYLILTYWKVYLTLKRDVLYLHNRSLMYFCIALIPMVYLIGLDRYKSFTGRIADKSTKRIATHDAYTEEKYTELSERAEAYLDKIKEEKHK